MTPKRETAAETPHAPEAPQAPPPAPPAQVRSYEQELRTLVSQFHARNCHGPQWDTCKNPECIAVQQALAGRSG